jgi:hypothetical protein
VSLTPDTKNYILARAGTTKTEKAQVDELIAACESLPVPVTQGDLQAAMAEVVGTDTLKGAKMIAHVREEVLKRGKANRLGLPTLSGIDFLLACTARRFEPSERGPIRELRVLLNERGYQVSDLFALIRKNRVPDPIDWSMESIGQVLQLVKDGEIGKASQASTVIVAQGEVTAEEVPLLKADPTPPTATSPVAGAGSGERVMQKLAKTTKCILCEMVFSSFYHEDDTCVSCIEKRENAKRISTPSEEETQVGASLAEHLEAQDPTPLSEATPRTDTAPWYHPPLDEWPATVWRATAKGSEGVRVRVLAVEGFGLAAKVTYKTLDDPSGIERAYPVEAWIRDFILEKYITLTQKEKELCRPASAATAPPSESPHDTPATAETGSSPSTAPSTSAPSAGPTAVPSDTPPTPDAPSTAPAAAAAPTLLTFPTSGGLEALRVREAELEETIQALQQELDQVRAAIADEMEMGEKRRKREELLAQLAALNAELGESA